MAPYLSPGVYVEELEASSRPIEGVGTAVAAFVGLATQGPVNAPTLVTNWNQFTNAFGDFAEGSYLAHAVYGYFANGGGSCYIVRIGGDGAAANRTNGASGTNGADGDGPAADAPPQAATGMLGAYPVRALKPGPGGNAIEIDVEAAESPEGGEGAPDKGGKGGGGTDEDFKITVRREQQREQFTVSTRPGRTNVATVVNAQSKLIALEEPVGAVTRPQAGTVALSGGSAAVVVAAAASAPAPVVATNGGTPRPEHYVGDSADRTGFAGLEAVEEVTILAVPDLMASYQQGQIDLQGVQAVHQAMLTHCELMGDRVAIIDPPPGLNAQQIKQWRMGEANYDSKQAALYWPWIKVLDPVRGQPIMVPPSGHVAGVWGRNDDTRGVHKAPANEVVRGALAPELQLTRAEQDLLNPVGINCIRSFPGRGIRVWGARTLSSDPAWRYLNVRRLFNYLEESILGGTQWAVFEPNDVALWAKLRRTISAFLVNEWRRGALFGLTPDEAFYVKCDEETNLAESIDLGQVICEIGVAPVKPAEFVVFRLAQFSGGASLVSE
ncbi:tail protein [Catellatospora sp. TT07R-123]|uniref:phage tail sheath family protein n=1 Tax=Catellatospora sp. TT07R-123 TaxID=2733863 RepID=UPI001B1337C5|nr:phage tail sheath subtilisin-like domain-containing protein [Catellatospora sp. TT07R-123]GHJ45262.1 tail protein [Catellatospora sp. TT07R-123]